MSVPSVNYIINGIQSVSYILAAHPLYSVAGAVAGLIFAIRLYCRYSLGICRCTTDLTGKTVIITGGNTGIGKETAIELARRNAKVIIGCRNTKRGSEAVKDIKAATGNEKVTFSHLDLRSFASVRQFAKNINETEDQLHILINNAGVTDSGGKRMITEDGCESIMQTNHFGHFLLTLLLIDLLKKSAPGRVINVSSDGYRFGTLDLEDLNARKKFRPLAVYCTSKLANILFTKELSKRLTETGVTVNTLHPGAVKTDILRNTPGSHSFQRDVIMARIILFLCGKTPLEGAQTTVHLALSPKLESVSGKYFADCMERKLGGIAQDEELARKLWKRSEMIVGLEPDSEVQ